MAGPPYRCDTCMITVPCKESLGIQRGRVWFIFSFKVKMCKKQIYIKLFILNFSFPSGRNDLRKTNQKRFKNSDVVTIVF